jgi:site-specific DNA-cytosine methylase
MNVLSLFDGIACGAEALKRINLKVDNYFSSEIDKNAIQIAKKNHSDIVPIGNGWTVDVISYILSKI